MADWSIVEGDYPYLTELGAIQPQASDFGFVAPLPTEAWQFDTGDYPYFPDENAKIVTKLVPIRSYYINKLVLTNIKKMFIRTALGLIPLHKAYKNIDFLVPNTFVVFDPTNPTLAWKFSSSENDGYPYF